MLFKKVIITGELAHFKSSRGGKNQATHDIPPISTVIGILKNIYGDTISNFKFGYTFNSIEKCKQMEKIHKEVNLGTNSINSPDRGSAYPSLIEYHVSPVLTIYHDIDKEVEMRMPLNLGRQCCMAKAKFSESELLYVKSKATNVITEIRDGSGIIHRGNTETMYNNDKGYFDIYTKLLRVNVDNEIDVDYQDEDGSGIYLWNYKEKGIVECCKEKL